MKNTGSLINNILSQTTAIPEVGMGATLLGWSDRYPATIVEVAPNGKKVGIQEDDFKRTDNNGMSEMQEYEFTPNTSRTIVYYTLRKNGRWVRKGESMNGASLQIGQRRAYYDFSF